MKERVARSRELVAKGSRSQLELELAIVEYVGWFNDTRLHGSLGDLPPREYELLHVPAGVPLRSPSGLAARDPDVANTLMIPSLETK